MIDNISDEMSDDAVRWSDNIIDDIIDVIADDVAAFQMYQMQSYAGKSGRQIFDAIPDDVTDDMANDIEGLIDYKLKSYVQVSGYSGPIPDDIKTVILDNVSGATRRKWLRELQTNASMLQADASKSAKNSDMLNEPAVDGILNLGQSMSDINITIAGQVISIGVDDLDSAYKKLKIYGAKMQHQNNKRYLIKRYGDAYIYIGGNSDEIINFIEINGLRALKSCKIGWYQYGDTMDSFIARHDELGDRDKYNGVDCITCYGDNTYKQVIQLSASDGHTIDEVAILFK